jgi:hypothetical protein
MTKQEVAKFAKRVKHDLRVAFTINEITYDVRHIEYSPNRKGDSVDWVYFEFLNPVEPPSVGELYRSWGTRSNDTYVGWLIPATELP